MGHINVKDTATQFHLVGLQTCEDIWDGLDKETDTNNEDPSPIVQLEPLLQDRHGQQATKDDGRDSQHLEESRIVHECQPHVAKRGCNDIQKSGLKL